MKEHILNIAIRQMKNGGYKAVNFANIADELNTTRANLHHHFKNKEGLGIAATQRYIEVVKLYMDDIVRKHDGDIHTILGHFEDHSIQYLTENNGENSCILSQLLQDGDAPTSLRELALERLHDEEALLEEQLLKAIQSGNLSTSADPQKLTFKIMTAMLGINQMGLLHSDRDALEQHVKGTLTDLLE